MRIGLGTAQFGLDYGVTNDKGRVAADEVSSILELAAQKGVDLIDTAAAYGTSEEVLGRAAIDRFRVVTKVPKLGRLGAGSARDELCRSFEQSLNRLGRPRAYGLLFHDPTDLLGPDGDSLWEEIERLKAEGLVEKAGASFYVGDEVDAALARYPLTLVQIPFNALDLRLVEGGQLERLRRAGVEIHARSILLQGLLLANRLPPQFGALGAEIARLDRAAASEGLTRLEALLAIAFQRAEISRFICGATSIDEFRAILAASSIAEHAAAPSYVPGPIDGRILSPQRWNELSEP